MKIDKTQKARSLYDQYVLHTYAASEMLLVRGAGTHVWDARGRRYLDFSSGISVCNLGHCHPAVTQAICEQAQKLVHVSNVFMNENQPRLAEKIITNTFGEGGCFFGNSGAEANECMIKLARKWGNPQGKNKIIAMNNSFHGRTLATLAATGRSKYREGFGPDMPGFTFVDFNDVKALKKAMKADVCGVIMEPIQGEGGILPADPEYLKAARKLCTEKGVMLLFDEVQCGMGRSGSLCAWQSYGVRPDAFTFAKAIANGIPMGVMVCDKPFASVYQPGTHGSTFGGTPLASAAACAVIDTILQDDLLDNCRAQSEFLFERLRKLAKKYTCIKEVRGRGLMIGVALDFPASKLLPVLRAKGLLALSAGETVLRLLPPLIVRKEECAQAVKLIDAGLKEYLAGVQA